MLWLLCPPLAALAQQPDLLLTAATVSRAGANDVAYIAWDSTTPGLLRGRNYALYAKPGAPGVAGAFTRQTILPLPATAATLAPLITKTTQLGFDPAVLRDALIGLGASATAATPDQLAALLNSAQTNPKLAEMLSLLARSQAAVELALGRAWCGSIGPGATTFELREFDARAQVDLVTVARVSVIAGAPILLPPPGAPVQVPDFTPSGDLLVKLRWATPPDLRRRSALARGYNVWRVLKADAERLGWFAQAPTLANLIANARRVNPVPVFTQKDFDAVTVLNFADPDAHFVDDNGRFADPALAFADGDEFAYVTTARDLLGRDGAPSLAGMGRACHTLPPRVPVGLKVENVHRLADQPGGADHQWFRLSWAANLQAAPDHTTHYELFRGTDLRELDTPGGPPAANFVTAVVHAGGQPVFSFEDQSLMPEANFFGKTFWFAVRARRDGACGPLYSAMSPPMFGALQKFAAPAAPNGDIEGNCPLALVAWSANQVADEPAPIDGRAHFRIQCRRRGPGILWAEFTVRVPARALELPIGRFFFPDDLDLISVDYTLAVEEADNNIDLWCRVASAEGVESSTASRPPDRQLRPHTGQIAVDTFDAAELTTWDIRPDDPLTAGLLSGIQCFQARSADASGLVVLTAGQLEGQQFAIVARDFGGVVSRRDRYVATVKVEEGTITFNDPALVGLDPAAVKWTYCGYQLSPNLVFGDCPHLARPDGSPRIHHVRVRLKLNAAAREYRLYRRVDDGPLELIAQGAADGSKLPSIPADDDTMPPRSARICYYGQLLDEHGNASPLALIGCREITANLPVPLLAAPQSGGDHTAPKMRLNWFCPAAGVDRFEVFLRPASGAITPSKFATKLAKTPASVFNSKAIHLVKAVETHALAKLTAEESFLTGRVGGDLGDGPQFNLAVDIEQGTTYDVWLKAVGPTGRRGQPSATQRFTWRPPPPPRQKVPWPARALPPKLPFNSLIVATANIDCPADRAAYPVGVRIGAMPLLEGRACLGPGQPIILASTTRFGDLSSADPNRWLFHDDLSTPPRTNVTLLPAVMYRQQVANASFPRVSGDVVQVSPLIEKIAWGQDELGRVTRAASLYDPFIGVKEQPNFGAANIGAALELILLDTRPVLAGARYRYWLLHFGNDGEPDGVISAGEVEVP